MKSWHTAVQAEQCHSLGDIALVGDGSFGIGVSRCDTRLYISSFTIVPMPGIVVVSGMVGSDRVPVIWWLMPAEPMFP